jgi:hypothetical protein
MEKYSGENDHMMHSCGYVVWHTSHTCGARSSVVVSSAMLQARRLWVWFLMRTLDCSVFLILPAAPWPGGLHSLLTERSTRNLPLGKGWLVHKADNLTANYVENISDRLCGLVVRVLGYRSGGPGSIPGTTRTKKNLVGLERGALSLVTTNWGATW